MFRMLFSYFIPHRRLFLLDMFCAVMVAVIDLAFPLVSRYAMYQMLPNQLYRAFFTVMLVMALCYVLRYVFQFTMIYWGHTFGARVETDIRTSLFKHLQELDFDFYDANRTGMIMSRLTGDLFSITELAHHGPEDLAVALLTITGALICMFSIEWRLALVIALILPISVLVVIRNRRRMLSVCRVKWSCMRVFLIICCINHRGWCLQRKMHMKKQL